MERDKGLIQALLKVRRRRKHTRHSSSALILKFPYKQPVYIAKKDDGAKQVNKRGFNEMHDDLEDSTHVQNDQQKKIKQDVRVIVEPTIPTYNPYALLASMKTKTISRAE